VAPVTPVVRHATQTSRAVRFTMQDKTNGIDVIRRHDAGGRTMRNSTVKAHPVKPRGPAPRVSDTGDARRQALDWLADQLRWERTLDAVRARSARRWERR
jgi:hypothetical protein